MSRLGYRVALVLPIRYFSFSPRVPLCYKKRVHGLHLRFMHRPVVTLLIPIAASFWVPLTHAAGVLPQGGQFVAGSGKITSGSSGLSISQTSTRGVIDWNTFSIGAGQHVTINNGSGATLNVVTGSSPSSISGLLSGTGSVYLINPQGVLVGPTGVITTGGRFVASTLGVSNSAFMNGGSLTLSGNGKGTVVNLGAISSTGGDVFLISRTTVSNQGTVTAPNGTAELAAGSQVLLQDSSSGPQVFVQAGSAGQVLNSGTIRAAQINLQAADGNVYALAGSHSVLRATGTATRDGHVWLVASTGNVNAQDTIEAANANGSGGTVDMSGKTLNVHGATVDAAQWNLTAPTFTIDAATASALAQNLSLGTSVDVTTTGAGGTSGDLTVSSSLSWKGAASLALNAYHTVDLGQHVAVANTGSGNLTLRADAAGIDNGGSVTNAGTIDWSKSTGIVSALYDMTGSWQPGTIRSNSAWSAAPFSGLLTQVTAYQLVNTLADLNNVSQNLAGIYALGNNIQADPSVSSNPIGGTPATPFTGQFDGMGHTISGLDYATTNSESTTGAIGLFSTVGTAGVVRNLGVVDASGSSIFARIGLIAGDNLGLITNSYSTGALSEGSFGTGSGGGVAGQNDGTIERSWSSAGLNGQGSSGGLVGTNNGLILQSYATGNVNGGTHGVQGGLVGTNSSTGVINQSYATGTISTEVGAGGLVGNNAGLIEGSYSAATRAAGGPPGAPYGGIAEENTGTIANNVFWDADTAGGAPGVANGTQIPAANGLTTAQMSVPASFGSSWNFSPNGTWAIPAGATSPVLRWQVEP
jgi:filamentous hemagglutinin family protein